jgi:hypothetical protein
MLLILSFKSLKTYCRSGLPSHVGEHLNTAQNWPNTVPQILLGLEESFELPVMLIDAIEQRLLRINICHDSSDIDASISFVLLYCSLPNVRELRVGRHGNWSDEIKSKIRAPKSEARATFQKVSQSQGQRGVVKSVDASNQSYTRSFPTRHASA